MPNLETHLKNSQFFSGLEPEDLKHIAGLAKEQTYPQGKYLVHESDKGDILFLILRGRVDVTVSLVGTAETEKIATLAEGELVGEMVLLGKLRRSANVLAKSDVQVLVWEIVALRSYFENNTRSGYLFMRNIAASIAERLASTNQVLRNVLTIPKNAVI